MNNWKKMFLSILTGVLISASFEPYGLSALVFVVYVPLFFVLESEQSFWRSLLYAWTAMFIQSLISFQWIHFVAREFGGLSWVVSFFVLIAFALATTVSIQIFAVLYYLARKYFKAEQGLIFYLLLVPGLFCLAEALDPKIFKWFLGDALTSYKYMAQFADILGVSGLSFLIFMVNVSVFLLIKKRRIVVPIIVCVLVPVFLFLYGSWTYYELKDVQEKCPMVRAGVVQANIGNPMQLNVAQAIRLKSELGYDQPTYVSDMSLIMKKYKSMTYNLVDANKGIDFIVWPETAFPGYYTDSNEAAAEHKKMVTSLGIPFLIGGYYLDNKDHYYNSAIMITPGGQTSFYHKKMLLPFGEYMPLGQYFPSLKRLVPAISDFSRGAGPSVFNLTVQGIEVRFAPTICYEILSSSYVGKMVDKDAHVLLNMSNDSWFGTVEPYQHLRVARMRAIEYRRPILRSTNTGVTTMVDITGDIIKKSKLNREENVVMDVPVCDHRMRTFYSIAGKYFIYVVGLACLLIIFWSRKKRSGTTL